MSSYKKKSNAGEDKVPNKLLDLYDKFDYKIDNWTLMIHNITIYIINRYYCTKCKMYKEMSLPIPGITMFSLCQNMKSKINICDMRN